MIISMVKLTKNKSRTIKFRGIKNKGIEIKLINKKRKIVVQKLKPKFDLNTSLFKSFGFQIICASPTQLIKTDKLNKYTEIIIEQVPKSFKVRLLAAKTDNTKNAMENKSPSMLENEIDLNIDRLKIIKLFFFHKYKAIVVQMLTIIRLPLFSPETLMHLKQSIAFITCFCEC